MDHLDKANLRIACRRPFWLAFASQLVVIVSIGLSTSFSEPLHAANSIRVVSQNVNRLFDNIDDGNKEKVLSNAAFARRLDITVTTIIDRFMLPDILALQEVENNHVLSKIAEAVRARSGVKYQTVVLEGNDVSGINLAYLIRQKFDIRTTRQLFKSARLAHDNSFLFSRPPLYLEACINSSCLSLLNLHLRSMLGIDSRSRGKRVRLKRLEQATKIAQWVEGFQLSRPQSWLLVLGDFNGLTPSDRHVDVVGTILGKPDNSHTRKTARDWISTDLVDLTRTIPGSKRYSYIYRKNKQVLDYMLTNSRFKSRLKTISFSRINPDFSDHAALLANFLW